MWRTAFLATAVALLLGTGKGHVFQDPEEVALRRRLWELEGELWESEQEQRQHIQKHHRRPLLGLLRSRRAPSSPHVNTAARSKLPGSHPAIRNLEHRQAAAANARSTLEENVNDAMAHLNNVGVIKGKLAKTDVQIRVEARKLKKLEEDRHRLNMTHQSLRQSLNRVMGPKLALAEERLLTRKRKLQDLQARDTVWRQAEEKFHAASLAMLKARGESQANLEAALLAEARAHQDRLAAEKQLSATKKDTSRNIQSYRYSEEEEHAAATKERHGEEATRRAEAALKRLSNIMSAEQTRVDESMALGKDRVEGKIRELEDVTKKSYARLSELKGEYAAWQNGQQAWRKQLASVREGTRAAGQDYADAQDAAFAAQHERIVRDAKKGTDWAWNDWPGMDEKEDAP